MILMNFKIKNSNRINYIVNEKGKIFGLSIDKNGIQPFQYDLLNYIINSIKFNDNCIKISKYKDYNVYYNPITNYKHYIKNNKEDHLMFYLKNGEDALLYKNNIEIKEKVKRFICSGVVAFEILGSSFLLINTGIHVIDKYSNDSQEQHYDAPLHIINNQNDEIQTTYFDEEIINNEDVTIDDLLNLINESNNISENDKKMMMNKELFEDLVPHYNNSYMKNTIKTKLKNITIKFEEIKGAKGYYNPLEPNVIHLQKNLKEVHEYNNEEINDYKEVMAHEYIHLLQADFYTYLKEAAAELISHEYLNVRNDDYRSGVNNLKLLIDIIGPESIFQGLFEGNYESFDLILYNNLEKNDRFELIKYLNLNPADLTDEENERFKEILLILYKNMYGQDIREDKDIMYEFVHSGKYRFMSFEKKYFKKTNNKETTISVYLNDEMQKELKDKGILNYEEIYRIKKEVRYEEFIKLSSDDFEICWTYNYDNINRILNKNITSDEELLIETGMYPFDAMAKGYITPIIHKEVSKKEKELYFKDWEIEFTFTSYEITQNNMRCESGELIITLPSIEERFKLEENNEKTTKKVNM